MGNKFGCFSQNGGTFESMEESPYMTVSKSRRTGKVSSSSLSEKRKFDDSVIRQQAIAAALLFQQHQQQNGSHVRFDRSTSVQYPLPPSNKNNSNKYPRSSTTRHPSLSDSLPNQLINQVFSFNFICAHLDMDSPNFAKCCNRSRIWLLIL